MELGRRREMEGRRGRVGAMKAICGRAEVRDAKRGRVTGGEGCRERDLMGLQRIHRRML